MKQTKLAPLMVTSKWPKGHKIRKTKGGSHDYYSKDESFDGIIQTAKELGRDTFIVGFSGGKDSGMVLDQADKKGELYGVFHIDTKTGVKVTQDFVKDVCQSRGLKLFIRTPTPLAFAYVAFCLEFGFPGPSMHSAVMKLLKYNTMKKFVQEPEFKGRNPAILGGIRKFESKERMGNYDAPITQDGTLWFVNPIFYRSDGEVYSYFLDNKLKRSPSYETMGFSGECNCGAFATHDEAKRLQQTDPDRADFISWIEEGIQRWGTPEAKKHSKWGRGEYGMDNARLQEMINRFFDKDEIKIMKRLEAMSCGSECGAGTMRSAIDY